MSRRWVITSVCMGVVVAAQAAERPDISELLARYAATQDRIKSWIIEAECSVKYFQRSGDRGLAITHDIRSDGTQISVQSYTWIDGDPIGASSKENPTYQSRSWDGRRHINYFHGGDPNNGGGLIVVVAPPANHIRDLRSNGGFLPIMGFYHRGVYDRIDTVIRQARSVSLHDEREPVHGVNCWVIDAESEGGDYTVWVDPEHGYNVARVRMERSAAKGHIWLERPMKDGRVVCTTTNLRFENVDGTWLPMESDMVSQSTDSMGNQETETNHVVVTKVTANPDHEALRSFTHEDIPEGTYASLYPTLHIGYTWKNGNLVPRFDKEVVARIDTALGIITAPHTEPSTPDASSQATRSEAELPSTEISLDAVVSANALPTGPQPQMASSTGPRPHCGLYCLYSFLRLCGRQVDYVDLIKPEYYGSREGSSLAELHRLAVDYSLHAEVTRRLSTRTLQDVPCQAVLHVRSDRLARDYNHYALFLGMEKGKAKLFDPPEAPKLVDLRELAYLWDGSALLVSSQPLDTDAVCAVDRNRLLFYWGAGMLICLMLYAGRLIWSRVAGPLPRRWAMGLTLSQAAIMILAAFIFGVLYHLLSDEALLANGTATASIQKAYQGAFIPRVSQAEARRLLGGDTVFIDARRAQDYERGHLDRAISLPVDANEALWKRTIMPLSAGKPIVVYCQSAGCKYAERVSDKLIEEGFKDISIYRGGWNDWTVKDRSREKANE